MSKKLNEIVLVRTS